MEIIEIKDGKQPRPYADHEYEWDIITDTDECNFEQFLTMIKNPYTKYEIKNAVPIGTPGLSDGWLNGNPVGFYKIDKIKECNYKVRVWTPCCD